MLETNESLFDQHSIVLSLFDMLQKLDLEFLNILVSSLRQIRELIDSIKIIDAKPAAALADTLAGMKQWFSLHKFKDVERNIGELEDDLKNVAKSCGATRISKKKVLKALDKIEIILSHELEKVQCYILTNGAAKHMEARVVPRVIRDKCPGCVFDLEEANKCLALDRNTACVYHSMMALEVVLPWVAKRMKRFGSTYNPKRALSDNWGRILKNLDGELNRLMGIQKSKRRTKTLLQLADLCARMRAVKDAWRNPTMHAGGGFPEEIATDILAMTTMFLKHVAGMKR